MIDVGPKGGDEGRVWLAFIHFEVVTAFLQGREAFDRHVVTCALAAKGVKLL